MKTTKDNIKNVIRDENLLSTINDIVIRTNKIVIHTYQFLKLYLLNLYKNNKSFPNIDKEFVIFLKLLLLGNVILEDTLKKICQNNKKHYKIFMINITKK